METIVSILLLYKQADIVIANEGLVCSLFKGLIRVYQTQGLSYIYHFIHLWQILHILEIKKCCFQFKNQTAKV